jgi:hypothetical protein
MSDAARHINMLHIPVRANRLGLADVRFDEFATSPVDEIFRAIFELPGDVHLGTPPANPAQRLIFGRSSVSQDVDLLTRTLLKNIEDSWADWSSQYLQASNVLNQVGQFELGGDFSPSKKLTDIWIAGLIALGKEAGRNTVATADFEVAQEFSHTLTSLFGTIGQQLRFQRSSDRAITKDTRFTPGYQIRICDAFLVIPDQASDFLDLLRSEISAALEVGCQISGAWGRIRSTPGGDLVFDLAPPSFASDPEFEESEEIE